MNVSEARTLRETDKVVFTWLATPDEDRTPGTVVGTNDKAVSIMWADSDGVPSVFFFDDEDIWTKVDHAPDTRVLIPIYDGRRKRPSKSRAT